MENKVAPVPGAVEPKKAPPVETKPTEAKLTEAKPTEAKPTETKAVAKPESKPTTLEALDCAVSKVGPAAAAASGSMSLNVAEGAKVVRTQWRPRPPIASWST